MSNAAVGGAAAQAQSEKKIINKFQAMIQRQRTMVQKLAELDAERMEYSRVASTLKPMDGGRKCFQLINQVLVERTLEEVVPIVDANLDGLTQVTKKIGDDLQTLAQEIREYQAKHNIRMVDKNAPGAGRPAGGSPAAAGGNAQGVLA